MEGVIENLTFIITIFFGR